MEPGRCVATDIICTRTCTVVFKMCNLTCSEYKLISHKNLESGYLPLIALPISLLLGLKR